jgi:hypothetical protein
MFLWEPLVQLRNLNREPARTKEALESQPEQKERMSQIAEPAEAHS